MTADLVYLLGTALAWGGLVQLLRAVYFSLRRDLPAADSSGPAIVCLVSGALLLTAFVALPMVPSVKPEPGIRIPLAWVYMPLPGWIALAGFLFAAGKFGQGFSNPSRVERRGHFIGAAVWLAVGVAGGSLMKAWGGQVSILKGVLPLSVTTLVAVLALAGATVALTALTAKAAMARNLGRNLVVTAMLLVGCVVFGFPFFWLLLGSVKEDRDQSNINGPIWIPKVQVVHPYDDPRNPLFEASYEGETVKARLDSPLGGGKLLLEIERPYGLRGRRFQVDESAAKPIKRDELEWYADHQGQKVTAFETERLDSGAIRLEVLEPPGLKGQAFEAPQEKLEPVRVVGPRTQNYTESLEWMPEGTNHGLMFLQNTLVLVFFTVLGTVLSCSLVGYGFSRLRFPGRDFLFNLMLSTMMLPAAVTMMPQFLIFRALGWIDTLLPLWVPAFFAGAFNVFLLRQFFSSIPMELEEAARIDGCGYFRTFIQVMLPQVKPALAAISIWTFMGAWNNFMGPLIYISSPDKMVLTYALQLFAKDEGGNTGLVMAFSTMAIAPVILLFFFSQRYFIEGVQLSGLGGR